VQGHATILGINISMEMTSLDWNM